MFKLEESSIPRHAGERCVRTFDDDSSKKYELDVEEESVLSEDLNPVADEMKAAEDESDSTDSGDDGPGGFPDTHIKIGSLSTQVSAESAVDRISESVASNLSVAENDNEDGEEEEGAIIHAAPQQMPRKNRIIQKAKGKSGDARKKQQQQIKQQKQEEEEAKMNQKPHSGNAFKRGQKSKLKKIKEKYKDQDEEEKQMRMEILKSAGKKKIETSAKEVEKPETEKPKRNPVQGEKKPQQNRPPEAGADLDAGDDDDTQGDSNDTDMLNSLTGLPAEEDELLFALPVVAPYNALHNYK